MLYLSCIWKAQSSIVTWQKLNNHLQNQQEKKPNNEKLKINNPDLFLISLFVVGFFFPLILQMFIEHWPTEDTELGKKWRDLKVQIDSYKIVMGM